MTSPRGRLGVQVNELTPQLAEYFGVKDGGVLVSSVTGDSPADKAGVKAGDVITSLNGGRVRDGDDLIDQLREKEGEVTVGILRDKKESTVKATLESDSHAAGTDAPAGVRFGSDLGFGSSFSIPRLRSEFRSKQSA